MIMYDEARQDEYTQEPVRASRQSLKMNLKQYMLQNKKYTNSPYILGKGLWEKMPNEIQNLQNKVDFKSKISPSYEAYDELYLNQ